MLPETHLVGKLWYMFPREVFLLFFQLLGVGAMTVTITEESFALPLSLNLAFQIYPVLSAC